MEFVASEFYGKETSLVACGYSPLTEIPPLNFAAVDESLEKQKTERTIKTRKQ